MKTTSKKTAPVAAIAPEVPATLEVIEQPVAEVPAQSDAEAAYGASALDTLLTGSQEDFLKADFEPAVLEEIYRRLKPKAKVSMPKSTAQSPCKLVWHIASAMPGAKREAVIAECVVQGISPNTAKTQYQHWKKAGQVPAFQPK